MVMSSLTVMNDSHSGIHDGLLIRRSHTGVRSIVTNVNTNLDNLRYVPITGAKL